MGIQIIQQPNKRYCLFSSIVDDVTVYDCSRDDLVEALLERERLFIEDIVDRKLERLEKGKDNQATSYPDMLSTVEAVHGEKKARELQSKIEGKN